MPGMGGGIGFSGGAGGISSGLNQWNFLRFESPENVHMRKRRECKYQKVCIAVLKSKYNEISGTVLLFKTISHYGLVIQMSGFFETENGVRYPFPNISKSASGRRGSLQDLSASLRLSANVISHRFYTGRKGEQLSTSPLKRYPFYLQVNKNLPPTFKCGGVGQIKYFVQVFAQESIDPHSLQELSAPHDIGYPGGGVINPDNSVSIRKELILEGVQIRVDVPRSEFVLGESIPVTITVGEAEKNLIKHIRVWLTRIFSVGGKPATSKSEVIHCVTFKRFLKRETFTRRLKFSTDKDQLPSFVMGNEPCLKIGYAIQVQVLSASSKSETMQMNVVLGREQKLPQKPSAPDSQQPSAPIEDVEKATAPAFGVRSLTGSTLSLFPPNYSTLPSRAVSMVSLETLPPDYHDICSSP